MIRKLSSRRRRGSRARLGGADGLMAARPKPRLSDVERDRTAHAPEQRCASEWCANAGLVLVALAVGLLLAEGALRLTPYRYLTHSTVRYPPHYFETDPELGIDLAPNRPPAPMLFHGPTFEAFTNALGCFDHDAPIGDGWVLAIGDSWTWGYAALQDKWTTHLETLSGRRVVKCGVSGTGPEHQRLKAEKTIEKVGSDPALIIVLYDSTNDFNDDAVFPGYAVVHGERVHNLKSLDLRSGAIVRQSPEELERKYQRFIERQAGFGNLLLEHSVAAAMVDHALSRLRDNQAVPEPVGPVLRQRYEFSLWDADPARYPWLEQAFAAHLDNILALRDLAVDHGAELVLITNDLPEQGLRGRLRAILERELTYVYDVAGVVEAAAAGRRTRYHHDRHWNALGNRLAGEAIFRYLTEVGLLRSAGGSSSNRRKRSAPKTSRRSASWRRRASGSTPQRSISNSSSRRLAASAASASIRPCRSASPRTTEPRPVVAA